MSILFAQFWDVMPGKYDDYVTFIGADYIPNMYKMGIPLVGGYYVKIGEGPRIVALSTVDEAENLRHTISSREYQLLSSRLLEYVWNYSNKVFAPSGRIQQTPYRVQTGVVKFNHHYNILRGMEEEHLKFIKEECMPTLEELKIPLTGGWRLIIGSGPRILAECTARNIATVADAVDTSLYRKLMRTIKNKYATDYSSRVLAPTGRVEVPYLVDQMMKKF
ncbi:MAG: hypothetical protein P4L43_11600 [Syntrophobacteraceae bacterium]|nr:hypothetical protein [Syntrophobacteraceae bacterium]